MKILSSLILLLTVSNTLWAQKPQLSVQTGHAATILDMAFSPDDGTILASVGADNNLILWDTKSFKQMMILTGHTAAVNALAFHPKQKEIATVSDDQSLLIRAYPSGETIGHYQFSAALKSVAYSPNGQQLACVGDSIYLIDLTNKQQRNFPFKARYHYDCLAYTPDGQYLAFGGQRERVIRIVDIESGQLVKRFWGKPNRLTFSDDQNFLYIADNTGKLRRKSWQQFSLRRRYKIAANRRWHAYLSLALNDDYLIGGNKDELIYIFDRQSGRKVKILKGHSGDVFALALSPDGRYLASSGRDRDIIIWNLDRLAYHKALLGGNAQVNDIAFDESGEYLFIAYQNGVHRLWHLSGKGEMVSNRTPDPGFWKNYFQWEYSANSTQEVIARETIPVKVNLNRRDKKTGAYVETRENLLMWYPMIDSAAQDDYYELTDTRQNTDNQAFQFADSLLILSETQRVEVPKRSLLNRDYVSPPDRVVSLTLDSKTPGEAQEKFHVSKAELKIREDVIAHAVSLNYRYFGALVFNRKDKNQCLIYDMTSKERLLDIPIEQDFHYIAFSPDARYFYLISTSHELISIYDRNTGDHVLSINGLYPLAFDADKRLLAYTDADRNLIAYDLETRQEIFSVYSKHSGPITAIKFNPGYPYLATASQDGLIKFWDENTGAQKLSLAAFGQSDFIYITPDNYYFATRGALENIGFKVQDKVYAVEQFDMKYNRPDIVLDSLGYASDKLLAAYNKAYHKRLKKMGFTQESLSEDFHIPEVNIKSELPYEQTDPLLNITIQVHDSRYKLDRLNVWINDVPVYGKSGIDLTSENSSDIEKKLSLQLSDGDNKVQISVINDKGAESLKETFTVAYKGPSQSRDLYMIVIGVSEYQDNNFNLNYAAKDANDLANLFENQKDGYEEKHIYRLLNEEATRKNILAMKNVLMQSNVNDEVILFVAGHGLLDANLDYYFATTEVNFTDPAENGLLYEDLENLLDGIPARKKLMMVDACHSGEVDKEEMEQVAYTETQEGSVTFRNAGNTAYRTKSDLGFNAFELMKELFADLRRGSGATVISAAGGAEFAFESEEWDNGVFTYSVLQGLKTGEADINGDGEVRVSELHEFVVKNVRKLTNGQQNPTSRRENLNNDFRIH